MVVDSNYSTTCSSRVMNFLSPSSDSSGGHHKPGNKSRKKSGGTTVFIFLAIVSITYLSGSKAAREWESRPHNYTVSEGPWFVPYISEVFGNIIPFPEQVFSLEPIVAKPYDFFISKPKEDWTAYQPMWLVSYQRC